MEEIIERTDGVPLFLEELTKAVLENASGPQIGSPRHRRRFRRPCTPR